MGRARGHVGANPHSRSVTRPRRVTGQHTASPNCIYIQHTLHTFPLLWDDKSRQEIEVKNEGGRRELQALLKNVGFFKLLIPQIVHVFSVTETDTLNIDYMPNEQTHLQTQTLLHASICLRITFELDTVCLKQIFA